MQNDEIETNAEKNDGASQYIDALAEMRKNSVSKSEYDKLLEQNKQLLSAMINGEEIEVSKPEEKANIEELRKDLFNNPDLTNLEYCEKTLKLRDAIIEAGGKDPFLPQGHDYVITQADVDTANKVAKVMKECIDYAEGDNSLFTTELQRRTNESPRLRK